MTIILRRVLYSVAKKVKSTTQETTMNEAFRKFSHYVANIVGSPMSFLAALTLIALWLCTGPIFHFSDTWQLVINTGTTIITFLMVFLIQNSQNRDARAIHLKLDELIRSVDGARTSLVNLESLPDDKLLSLQQEFERLQLEFGVETIPTHHIDQEVKVRKHRRHHKQ
jgi:low affinity Fe/Cu permease